MKIVDVRIDECVLPKKDKDWKFALAANPTTEGWIVNIRTEDGTVGYGYASTMNHYGAPHEAVKGALDRLCKRLIGRDFARDREHPRRSRSGDDGKQPGQVRYRLRAA